MQSRERDKQSRVRSRLYNTARWKRVRRRHLQDNPLCVECMNNGRGPIAASVVDHRRRVNDGADFWDASNYQSMCKPCHDRKRGRESHEHKPRG